MTDVAVGSEPDINWYDDRTLHTDGKVYRYVYGDLGSMVLVFWREGPALSLYYVKVPFVKKRIDLHAVYVWISSNCLY